MGSCAHLLQRPRESISESGVGKDRTVSGRRKKEMLRLLQDPAVSKEEKDRLVEELYQDIDVRTGN